jgi:hypothetical protein
MGGRWRSGRKLCYEDRRLLPHGSRSRESHLTVDDKTHLGRVGLVCRAGNKRDQLDEVRVSPDPKRGKTSKLRDSILTIVRVSRAQLGSQRQGRKVEDSSLSSQCLASRPWSWGASHNSRSTWTRLGSRVVKRILSQLPSIHARSPTFARVCVIIGVNGMRFRNSAPPLRIRPPAPIFLACKASRVLRWLSMGAWVEVKVRVKWDSM